MRNPVEHKMHLNEQIYKSLADYLDPYDRQMRTPTFFMLPTVHINLHSGTRFVVSNCSSPLEKASELIHFYLLQVVISQPTLSKGHGRHYQTKIENEVFSGHHGHITLANLDVVSMFTSFPLRTRHSTSR